MPGIGPKALEVLTHLTLTILLGRRYPFLADGETEAQRRSSVQDHRARKGQSQDLSPGSVALGSALVTTRLTCLVPGSLSFSTAPYILEGAGPRPPTALPCPQQPAHL